MEICGNLSPILGSSLVRLDAMRLKQLQCEKVYKAIDSLCQISADSVHLRNPLTTCEKLIQSDHVLYLAWEYDEEKDISRFLGILKVGRKKLFLYDRQMITYEGEFLCLLDFYVHFNHQRKGIGRQLFECMLKNERVQAFQVPLDNPTVTLLAFMNKSYDLTDPVWQNTNFVVFPQVFESVEHKEDNTPEGWRRPATPRHIGNGTSQTRWLNQAITGHRVKGQATGSPVDADTSTEGTLANRAHQARQRKNQLLSSKPLWCKYLKEISDFPVSQAQNSTFRNYCSCFCSLIIRNAISCSRIPISEETTTLVKALICFYFVQFLSLTYGIIIVNQLVQKIATF